MFIIKKTKDHLIKLILGEAAIPRGLFELAEYFRLNGPISFEFKQGENNKLIAVSTNFRHGSIVTSGKDNTELDKNIKDAILTSFEIPSSYAHEAKIYQVGEERRKEYALA